MSRTRVSIPFSQRGPIPIHLEDSYTGSPTGCSVIDVIFPQGEEISEVRFKSVLWHHLCGVVFSNLDSVGQYQYSQYSEEAPSRPFSLFKHASSLSI